MNARATSMRPAMGRAEHISLEAEPVELKPVSAQKARVLATFVLNSRFRGLHTALALLDGHLLQVDSRRPGATPRRYVLDLRFVNAQPVRARNIAWLWAVDTMVLLLLAAVKFWRACVSADDVSMTGSLGIGVGALIAACLTATWFARSTIESLSFESAHGSVPMVQVAGGIGSAKAGKKFFVQLIRSITEAKSSGPANKHQYLRDEMREHHRLHELGVLTDELYELGKSRILQAF